MTDHAPAGRPKSATTPRIDIRSVAYFMLALVSFAMFLAANSAWIRGLLLPIGDADSPMAEWDPLWVMVGSIGAMVIIGAAWTVDVRRRHRATALAEAPADVPAEHDGEQDVEADAPVDEDAIARAAEQRRDQRRDRLGSLIMPWVFPALAVIAFTSSMLLR